MTVLNEWAAQWRIPLAALEDLRTRFGLQHPPVPTPADADKRSEAWASSAVRLEAARKGHYLWRNNNGAGYMQDGSFIRWGLCNDSKALNERVKSPDLIGIRRMLIEPRHVGSVFGQFLAREVKPPGWRFTGDDHEVAQLKYLELVAAAGGDACFATGEGTL